MSKINNIKTILQLLGVKNKEIADYIGVSLQSLNIIFRSETPRKYNNEISQYLKIDSKFIIKEILTEDDKNEIVKQHFNISATKLREELTLYKNDLILMRDDFLEWILDYVSIDFDWLDLETKAIGVEIPKYRLEWGELELSGTKFVIKSNKEYVKYSIEVSLLEKAIIQQKEKVRETIIILTLSTGITFIITLPLQQ